MRPDTIADPPVSPSWHFVYRIKDDAGRVLLHEDMGRKIDAVPALMKHGKPVGFLFGTYSEIWLELPHICLEFFPNPDIRLLAQVSAELEKPHVDPMAYREDFRVPPNTPHAVYRDD